MSLARWMAIATLVAAPFAAIAQENSRAADPADPAAPGNPFRYESAFNNYQSIPESDEAPSKVWRAANDEMGTLGGHAGHIKTAPAATRPPGNAPASPQSETMPADHGNHGMPQKNKGQ